MKLLTIIIVFICQLALIGITFADEVVQIIDVSSDGYVAPEPVDVSIPDVNIESMEEDTFSPEPIQIDSGSD